MFISSTERVGQPAVKQRLFDAPRVYPAANAHSFRKERDKEWGTRPLKITLAQECRSRKAWPAPAQAAQSVHKRRQREVVAKASGYRAIRRCWCGSQIVGPSG
jgi:hypothetical protein